MLLFLRAAAGETSRAQPAVQVPEAFRAPAKPLMLYNPGIRPTRSKEYLLGNLVVFKFCGGAVGAVQDGA